MDLLYSNFYNGNRWIYYNAHWRILANTVEPLVRGGQGGLSKNSWSWIYRDAIWRAHSCGPDEPYVLDGVQIDATW